MDDPTTPARAGDPHDPMPCITCGYNLHRQPRGGLCPECATPVERSLTTNTLKHADRTWLTGLSRACILLLTTVVLFIIAMLTPFGLAFANLNSAAVGMTFEFLLTGTMLAGFITFILGLFLLTAQEPRDALTEGDLSTRSVVRGCTIAMPILFLIDDLFPPPWSVFVLAAFFAAMIVGLVGALRRLEDLARRVPSPELVSSARRSQRAVGGLGGATALVMTAGKLTLIPPWVLGLSLLVFLIAAFRGLALFARLRNILTPILQRGT